MEEIIIVTDLVKKFKDFTAVDQISFRVKAGEIFAFLGPNGAGKTTTIKMLTTLLHPTAGTIMVNGFDSQTEQQAVRRSFGIVFQDPSLDDELTADENMQLHAVLYDVPKAIASQRIAELLTVVDLSDRRRSLVKTFSGGMKRRLEIARGLLHHPQVIFLDEPTQGLDPQTRNKIWDYIRLLNQKEGITIFFTTHYLEEAEKAADTVAIIDQGKILTQGSAADLKQETGTKTLEEAFLQLTGHAIREEEANGIDQMRMRHRVFHR